MPTVRLPCSSPCTGSTSSSPCCPHISWTTAGTSDRLRHARTHRPDLPDERLHPLLFHPLPDSHTPDTHTHHAMCCCHAPSADAKACRCTCSHLPSLSLSRSHDRFSCVAPRCNERPGSPCSIFHAGANAALSSFKPSQGFVSTYLMQIPQI